MPRQKPRPAPPQSLLDDEKPLASKRAKPCPRLVSMVLDIIAELEATRSSTFNAICERITAALKEETGIKPRNIITRVRQAVKHAISSGVLKQNGALVQYVVTPQDVNEMEPKGKPMLKADKDDVELEEMPHAVAARGRQRGRRLPQDALVARKLEEKNKQAAPQKPVPVMERAVSAKSASSTPIVPAGKRKRAQSSSIDDSNEENHKKRGARGGK